MEKANSIGSSFEPTKFCRISIALIVFVLTLVGLVIMAYLSARFARPMAGFFFGIVAIVLLLSSTTLIPYLIEKMPLADLLAARIRPELLAERAWLRKFFVEERP